jgi:hypothetical protein
MSEIEKLVRIQDARWAGPEADEPKWLPEAKNMEAWPPHVPRRMFDPDREWRSLSELIARQLGRW